MATTDALVVVGVLLHLMGRLVHVDSNTTTTKALVHDSGDCCGNGSDGGDSSELIPSNKRRRITLTHPHPRTSPDSSPDVCAYSLAALSDRLVSTLCSVADAYYTQAWASTNAAPLSSSNNHNNKNKTASSLSSSSASSSSSAASSSSTSFLWNISLPPWYTAPSQPLNPNSAQSDQPPVVQSIEIISRTRQRLSAWGKPDPRQLHTVPCRVSGPLHCPSVMTQYRLGRAHPLLSLLADGTGCHSMKGGHVVDVCSNDGNDSKGGDAGVVGMCVSLWQISDTIARISGNVTNRMDDHRLDWSSYLSLDVLFLTAHLYICSPLPTILYLHPLHCLHNPS